MEISAPRTSSPGRVLQNVVIAVLVPLIALHLAKHFLKRRRVRKHSEALLDETLAATFPASDAPASQDFGIPDNRS